MAAVNNTLVIGAGELGLQVLKALVQHPGRDGPIAVLLRPGTISSSDPAKRKELDLLRDLKIELIPGDIVQDSEQKLASVFANYRTVIGCAGFVSGTGGIQLKITRAALVAGVSRFVPWQFGVDYDAIGRGSPQDLFDEQLDVRDALRSQNRTRWTIISTGMFTSFLFEPSFGVINLEHDTVCALGSEQTAVTLTTPEDIGRMTADIILSEEDASFANKPVFIGGDTITYGELGDLVERVVQRPIKRTVLSLPELEKLHHLEPENNLIKYQYVFGLGRGVAWELTATWNHQRGIRAKTAKEWAQENLR